MGGRKVAVLATHQRHHNTGRQEWSLTGCPMSRSAAFTLSGTIEAEAISEKIGGGKSTGGQAYGLHFGRVESRSVS